MICNVNNLLTKLSTSEDDHLSLQFLKSTIINLTEIVKEQQSFIDHQAGQIQGFETIIQESKNEIYSLSKRVIDLERYSRKLCLIFDSLEVMNDGGLSSALNIMQSALKMHIGPQDIAACHPLTNGECAPVIVKFIYHYHRDLAWDRKASLRFWMSSEKRPIYIRECLAPIDREIQAEARRLNLRTATKNQQVFVCEGNGRNQHSYKINHIDELKSFGAAAKTNTAKVNPNVNTGLCTNQDMDYEPRTWWICHDSNTLVTTPLTMPRLYCKPSTPFLKKTERKKALDLSPLTEAPHSSEEGLVSMLAEALVPALNKMMKQFSHQVSEGASGEQVANEPFREESTVE